MDDPELYVVPIPIRPGVNAAVQVPRDLTKLEAEKIARVVMALGDGDAMCADLKLQD